VGFLCGVDVDVDRLLVKPKRILFLIGLVCSVTRLRCCSNRVLAFYLVWVGDLDVVLVGLFAGLKILVD
jgi:hypothetical protein